MNNEYEIYDMNASGDDILDGVGHYDQADLQQIPNTLLENPARVFDTLTALGEGSMHNKLSNQFEIVGYPGEEISEQLIPAASIASRAACSARSQVVSPSAAI